MRGTIKQLLVNTVGGVIQPGEDLVEIVPLEDTLLVEAKVRPADIAFLRPGQAATVKVTAYDFSIYGGLDGVVEDISADTITDERRRELLSDPRAHRPTAPSDKAGTPLPIIPGMTTEVDILTGEKTVMDYLLKPILRAQQRRAARALSPRSALARLRRCRPLARRRGRRVAARRRRYQGPDRRDVGPARGLVDRVVGHVLGHLAPATAIVLVRLSRM